MKDETNFAPVASPDQSGYEESKPVAARHLNILRHAIGYDDAGNDRYPNARSLDERRNRFITGPGSDDFGACQALVAVGFMTDHGAQTLAGGDHCFTVTDSGRALVLENRPAPKKVSAGRRRYLEFLDADCGMKFGDWLKGYKRRKEGRFA